MNIKLSIPVLQTLTNNEAFTYFCTLVAISKNPDSTIKDIVRITGVSETTIFNHLKEFEEVANLTIDRTGCSNKYSYTEPTKFFVTISLNRIVHEIGVQHNTVYSALEAGLVERSDKKLYFKFIHPSLCIL